jgi:hypothetical protein
MQQKYKEAKQASHFNEAKKENERLKERIEKLKNSIKENEVENNLQRR